MAANKCFFRPCNGKDDWKTCGPAGINTIINRSKEKDDELYKQFSDNTAAVVCQKSCYSSYTSLTRNTVISSKRKSVKGELECEPPNRLSRSMIAGQVINRFDFKLDCMFCGNECIPQDPKHPDRWEKVRECQTDKRPGQTTFKDVVIDMCDQRADDWSRLVENRINGVLADLPAADARYHDKCYQEFRYVPVDSTKSVTGKSVDDSLKRVIVGMRANRALTWTVAELYSIYFQNAGEISRRQMLHQLSSFFGEEMLVIQVEGCNTLVGFKKFVTRSLKLETLTKSDTDSSLDNLVRRVKAEVADIPLPRDYNLRYFTREKCIEDTSETLLKLLSHLISDGEISKESLTLAQCIQYNMTMSRNQTSLGLALKLHQKHGSSELLRTLHSRGLISPYDEVIRFKKSAAVFSTNNKQDLNNMLGFSRELGPISAWCDNLDLFVFSPNGRRSTHVMVSEFNQHLSSEGTIEQRADVGLV